MTYSITHYDGTSLITIADASVDTTATSLKLLGRNYAGYGTIVADNFVYLLENFANTTAPLHPLEGQLWFNTTTGEINLRSGSAWHPVGSQSTGLTITETTADNTGLVFYDPLAPVNSRYYRIRVRDDGSYDGHWVLESLNDDQTVHAVILDTDNTGDMKLAVTPSLSDNTTLIATTAFVKGQNYAPLASPAFTGTPTLVPTLSLSDNTQNLATTAFVKGQAYAPLASPTFTGTPAAPTPSTGDNTTKLATTAFVKAQNYQPAGSYEPALGFTPVQQGGTAGQLSNKVFIGWDGTHLRAKVDATDLGEFVMGGGSDDDSALVLKTGDTMSGTLVIAAANGLDIVTTGTPMLQLTASGRYAYGIYIDFASNDLIIQRTDGNFNGINGSLFAITPSGQIYGQAYGFLENYFAQRPTALGLGSTNATGNCGATPLASGYEVFDVGDGRHQIRVFQNNCTDCGGGGNCNCDCVGTCFPPWAMVVMADGREKPIKDVRVGEFVMGRHGEANEVLAKEYPPLGHRSMYHINREHWTTDEHPHLIREGFSAIAPTKYFEVDVGLWWEVELADGSRATWQNRGLPDEHFHEFKVGVHACYRRDYRRIDVIEAYDWSPDFVLYNLVLAGSHTYHVDGYLVTGWPQSVDFNYKSWQPTGVSYTIPKRAIS